MNPCAYCGNTEKGLLNRHHWIPREHRTRGTSQLTVKLCRDQHGCQVHRSYHQHNRVAAHALRRILENDPNAKAWLTASIGSELIDELYPYLRGFCLVA